MPVNWEEYQPVDQPKQAEPVQDWSQFEIAEPPRPQGTVVPPVFQQRAIQGGPSAPLASFAETIAEPVEEITNPRITLPRLKHEPDDSLPMTVGKEAVNVALGIPEFFTSTAGILSAAVAPAIPTITATAFTADMLHSLGQGIRDTYKNWDAMNRKQKAIALTDLGATGLMALATGTHAIRGGLKAGEAAFDRLTPPAPGAADPNVQAWAASFGLGDVEPVTAIETPQARVRPTQPYVPPEPGPIGTIPPIEQPSTERTDYAVRNRIERERQTEELPRVPSRQDVRPNEEEIRQATGGQAGGGGGIEPSPQGQETPPAPDVVLTPPPPAAAPTTAPASPEVSPPAASTPTRAPEEINADIERVKRELRESRSFTPTLKDDHRKLRDQLTSLYVERQQAQLAEAAKPVETPKAVVPPEAPKVATAGTRVGNYVKGEDGWYLVDEQGNRRNLPRANKKISARLEQQAAAPPAPAEPRSHAEILSQAAQVRVRVPEGATVVRVTDTEGRKSDVFIADANRGDNVFRGVDVAKVEAGAIGKDRKFKKMEGEVTVSEVKPPSAREREAKGPTVETPISQEAASGAVQSLLGKVPENVSFTTDTSAQRGRVVMEAGKPARIELNLSAMDSPQAVRDTLLEELVHGVWDSPDVAQARASIEQMVAATDTARKIDQGYLPDVAPEEAANQIVRDLFQQHAQSGLFTRAVNQVVLAVKKFFGIDLTPEQAALHIVNESLKNRPGFGLGERQSLAKTRHDVAEQTINWEQMDEGQRRELFTDVELQNRFVEPIGEAVGFRELPQGVQNKLPSLRERFRALENLRGRAQPAEAAPASFDAMMADPAIRPEIKQVIAGDMAKNLLDFRDATQRSADRATNKIAEYEAKLQDLLQKLDVERERRTQLTDAARQVIGQYQSGFLDRLTQANQAGQVTSAAEGIKNLETLKQTPAVIERVIQQIAATVPDEVLTDPNTTSAAILDSLLEHNGGTPESLSAALGETGTQFSTDWVRNAIEVMRGSDSLAQIILNVRNTLDPTNWQAVQSLATELTNAARRGARGDLRRFAREVGETSRDLADARKVISRLNPKIGRAARQLDEWVAAQDVIGRTLQDPALRNLETKVYGNFDVRKVVVTRGGDHEFIFKNPLSGEDVKIFPTMDAGASGENYERLQRLFGDAATYLSDPSAPGYDPRVAAAWRYLIDNAQGFWLNPSLNAFMPHMTPFFLDLPAFLSDPYKILRPAAGLDANASQVALSAMGNARKRLQETEKRYGTRVQIANKKAANAANMTVQEWHERVFNEIAHRYQFIGQIAPRVWDILLSGHRVTDLDITALKLQYEYGRKVRDIAENAAGFTAAQINPARIVRGDILRKAVPTGERTLPSRRSAVGNSWGLRWRELADPQRRLAWLDDPANFERIVMGHIAEYDSPGYLVPTPFRGQYRTIMSELRSGDGPENISDLVQRIYERQNFTNETNPPLSQGQVRDQLYRELDRVFDNYQKEGEAFSPKPAPVVSAIAAENSFTKPRSERRGVPFTFYSHGAADFAGRVRLTNDAYVWHVLDFVESLKGLSSGLKKRIDDLTAAGVKKTGNDWYDLGQLKINQDRINTLIQQQTRVLKSAQDGRSRFESAFYRAQAAVGTWILMSPGARMTHTFGMMGNSGVFNLLAENKVLVPQAKAWGRMLGALVEDIAKLPVIGTSTEKLKALRASLPIAQSYFDMVIARREQMQRLQELGIIPESDVAGVARSTWLDLKNVLRDKTRPLGQRVVSALTSVADLHNAMGMAWAPQRYNDWLLNSHIRELRQDMVRDMMEKSLRYIQNRRDTIGSGYSDFSRPENVLTAEEITGSKGPTAVREAFEKRKLFKVLGMDLDQTMLRYYEAVARAKQNGEDPSQVSFLTPDQENSLDFDIAQNLGLATPGTRNLASQGSLPRRALGYIHGLPLFVMGKNLSLLNRLNTQSYPQYLGATIPLVLGASAYLGAMGLARIQGTATANRFLFNQASALPTIAQAKTPDDWARLLIRSEVGWWPIIGDVILGAVLRTPDRFGHLDSMFVMQNMVVDAIKTLGDVWNTKSTQPFLRFLDHWAPPTKIVTRRMESQTGVTQHFNALADIQSAIPPSMETASKRFRGSIAPTATTPITFKALNAMYNGDWNAFNEAQAEYVQEKTKSGAKNPELSFKESILSHNPWISRLGKLPTEEERQEILGRMTDQQRDEVLKAENVFRQFGDLYGVKVHMTAEEAESAKGGPRAQAAPSTTPSFAGLRIPSGSTAGAGGGIGRIGGGLRRISLSGPRTPRIRLPGVPGGARASTGGTRPKSRLTRPTRYVHGRLSSRSPRIRRVSARRPSRRRISLSA